MKRDKLPRGWDEQSLQELVDFYDRQTDGEAAAEHAAALADAETTLMEVPTAIVPLVRELIAKQRRK